MNQNTPKHIVIIPDGNRRWAKERGLKATLGHKTAAEYNHIESLIKEAKNLGIEYFSIWAFSTENWKRDKQEIKTIFNLIQKLISYFNKELYKNKIRFRHLGRKDRLPKKLAHALENLEQESKNYSEFNVQLCLDYGGKDEIIRAVNKALKSGKKEINEKEFHDFLDTKNIPEPDLIIRTSGEQRTSGIMPFQSAYAELYFIPVYFPDFDSGELKKAVEEFQKRQRRFGGS